MCLPPGLLRALSGVTYPKVKLSFLSKEFAPDPGFPVTGKQHHLLKPEPGRCLITNILDNALPVHLNSVSLFLVCKIGIEISTSYLIGLLRIKWDSLEWCPAYFKKCLMSVGDNSKQPLLLLFFTPVRQDLWWRPSAETGPISICSTSLWSVTSIHPHCRNPNTNRHHIMFRRWDRLTGLFLSTLALFTLGVRMISLKLEYDVNLLLKTLQCLQCPSSKVQTLINRVF